RFDVLGQIAAAHDVENDVGAAILGVDHGWEVLLPIVDQGLGAEFTAAVELVLAASGHSHVRTQRAAHLYCVRADSASAAVNEQRLTLAKAAGHHHVRPHRGGGFRQRCRGGDADAFRHWQHLGGGHVYPLGVTSAGQQRTHLIAGRPILHSGTDFGNHTGDLETGYLADARLQRVDAHPLHHGGPVHARGYHIDGYLTRTWRGQVVHFVPFHHLGIAETVELYRIHGTRSPIGVDERPYCDGPGRFAGCRPSSVGTRARSC